jgi:hypothetical protein
MPKIWNPNWREETNWNMMKIPMATIISFFYTYISYTRNSLFIYKNKGNLEHLAIIIEMIVNIADNPLNVELEMKWELKYFISSTIGLNK